VIGQNARCSIRECRGEKERSACEEIAPVTDHALKSTPDFAALNPGYVLGADVEACPDAGGDIGERIEILLRGVDQFCHRGALIGVHARQPRRHGKLHHAGLGAHERGDEAGRVHSGA